jgi:hypothetical protein
MRPLSAALVILAAACGGSGSTNPASVAGVYDLQTVNGAPLPYTVPGQSSGNITQVLRDQLTLANGAVGEHGTWRAVTSAGTTQLAVSDTGTYSVSGSTVTLHMNSGVTGRGSGNRITLTQYGAAYLYVRQ